MAGETIKNEYTVVGVCGYGNSGASAVMDLLRGSDELQVNNEREWQILHSSDGILDLKHYIVECKDKVASNTAVKRYEKSLNDHRYWAIQKRYRKIYVQESKRYADNLKCCTWRGYSSMDAGDILGLEGNKWINAVSRGLLKLGKLINLNLSLPPAKERYFSIMNDDEFNRITSEYLSRLFRKMGYKEDKPVVLEQFFIYSNPELGHEFFNKAKTILIERDPRDVYASSRFSAEDGAQTVICRFMPTDSVEKFVGYFKRLHLGVYENRNVYIVHFEDLIYDYQNTVQRLCDFLKIENTDGLNRYFHPDISINNTKFYKKFPEIAKDIKYIEMNLKAYINHYVD